MRHNEINRIPVKFVFLLAVMQLVIFIFLCCAPLRLLAQYTTASMAGNVVDPTGAMAVFILESNRRPLMELALVL